MPGDSDRIALFDLDGTLADFEGSLRTRMNLLRGPSEPPITESTDLHELEREHPYIRERMDLVKAQPGFWRDLEPLDDGFVILAEAIRLGFSINVLSKGPSRLSAAWSEKHEWCLRQPLLAGADIHLTMNKALTFGLLLCDDWPAYMDAWLKNRPRGLGIMPVRPYNVHYSHPNVVKFDSTNLAAVTQAMTQAFARVAGEPLTLR
jgi:5'-nucleotidase